MSDAALLVVRVAFLFLVRVGSIQLRNSNCRAIIENR